MESIAGLGVDTALRRPQKARRHYGRLNRSKRDKQTKPLERKDNMKIFTNILKSIVGVIFAIIGSVVITPLLFLRTLFELPICVVQDIWEDSDFQRLEI